MHKKEEKLHQTGTCITIIRVGKHPTCTGDRLANVSQGAQVGFLGLVTMLPQQGIGDFILEVCLQKAGINLIVYNHL